MCPRPSGFGGVETASDVSPGEEEEVTGVFGVEMMSRSHRIAPGIRGPVRNSVDAERGEFGICHEASMILVVTCFQITTTQRIRIRSDFV